MKNIVIFVIVLTLSVISAKSVDLERGTTLVRIKRGIKDWFTRSQTTPNPPTTTPKPKFPNNLDIGECREGDKIIYIDETKFESNNATLSGVIEIYIDSPYKITCARVTDLIPEGNGAVPTLGSGGRGENFMFINVQGQEGYGFHFRIVVRGSLEKNEARRENNELY